MLRRLTLARLIDDHRARAALGDWLLYPVVRHSHETLLPRIWELRRNVTAYDAAYIALAEALGAPLVTRDAGLAAAPGHSAKIEVV